MPIPSGVSSTGMKVEPFATIMSYAPRGYWRMGETSGVLVNSGSVASKNATATSVTYNQAKIPTRSPLGSVSFNGTTSYAQITDSILPAGTGLTYSFGCWISTTSATGARVIFQQMDATGSGAGFKVWQNGDYIYYDTSGSGGSDQMFAGPIPTLTSLSGAPIYIGITSDSNYNFLYINGQLWKLEARTSRTFVSTSDCFIGRNNTADSYFSGKISDVFVTSTALTQLDHYKIYRNGMVNPATPVNDNLLDAIEIPIDDTPVTYTNVNSTFGPDDRFYQERTVTSHSVWFTIDRAPDYAPVIITIDPAASNVMRCNGYTLPPGEVPSENTSAWEVQSDTISQLWETPYTTPEPGTVECISVARKQDEYGSTSDPSTFTIKASALPAAAANDNFADAISINTTTYGSTTGSTVSATLEDQQEPFTTFCNTHSVWYKFTAASTGHISIDTCDDAFGYYSVAVWDKTADSITTVADVDWFYPLAAGSETGPLGCGLIVFPVVSGHEYRLHVTQYATLPTIDPFTLSWSAITASLPSNDNFANATTINPASAGNIAGTTFGTDIEVVDETTINSGYPLSVWYKFQAGSTGNITLDTELSPACDSAISVWAGTSGTVIGDLDVYTAYASNDDGGTGSTALLTFAVTSGTWYYVQITDYVFGRIPFTLRWSVIT